MRAVARLIAALVAASFGAHAVYTDEPLEPEKAFAVRAAVSQDGRGKPKSIELRFSIAPGYYLYRDRFRIEAPGLETQSPRLPAGIAKNDPFVGPSRIFKRAVVVGLPLKSTPPAGEYELAVTSQGCAEDRVCYAPFTQNVRVRIP